MNEDIITPWLLQPSPIWMALASGFVPGLIAASKGHAITRWYFYGFAFTLIAWPLLGFPTIHALLIHRRDIPKRFPQQQRRSDALALIADRSVRSYPSWIADLKRKSPSGIDRRRYAYQLIGPGEALELVREPAHQSNDHAVAYRHRGVHLGYVPRKERWIAEALDDGLCLTAVAEKVKVGWLSQRAKFVGTRIVILNDARRTQ
jgi:HIRAN domain